MKHIVDYIRNLYEVSNETVDSIGRDKPNQLINSPPPENSNVNGTKTSSCCSKNHEIAEKASDFGLSTKVIPEDRNQKKTEAVEEDDLELPTRFKVTYYRCLTCSRSFDKEWELTRHQKRAHDPQKKYLHFCNDGSFPCLIC